ncbi:hypothetical protein PHYBLDRAFT_63844 [Phycomyces blakesleeanus NRRL 1555(-)]|uniref:Uncharacterized protein n=1 Tax=Phycomyces blakesleeanus (strain ATCC 8743b / DSM 1359 / FGSC 10004 / NBRC 33097 / NRRL 1555) TaxID=763407 RepID=A0A167MVY4_PHYB8|nr:hypothetical protein PHYBLDRAFT_63844 [Phycomyces blakesleeanus NRRL 1555(-)]OAD74204.1 hypothetical protein PHYBLDRAFT_63844 [Phycomyces blakesleeanus NRRL 1555(-)]|eukprot:XP_018292244.1 hypothetical protein PHYBLDRAFT_63844 [Phycomyces blakesleeanus NRRL 1555(-)]
MAGFTQSEKFLPPSPKKIMTKIKAYFKIKLLISNNTQRLQALNTRLYPCLLYYIHNTSIKYDLLCFQSISIDIDCLTSHPYLERTTRDTQWGLYPDSEPASSQTPGSHDHLFTTSNKSQYDSYHCLLDHFVGSGDPVLPTLLKKYLRVGRIIPATNEIWAAPKSAKWIYIIVLALIDSLMPFKLEVL